MARMGRGLGFAPDHDIAVPYIERSRDFYLAMGYPKPYDWAHLTEVAFTPLKKPLSQSKLSIVTTAAPIDPDKGDQGPGAPMNPKASFDDVYTASTDNPPALGISHVHYDRKHAAIADQRTFMPLPALHDAAAKGRISSVARHFYGVPTRYSHRLSMQKDGPELVAKMREDGVDAAVLIAI